MNAHLRSSSALRGAGSTEYAIVLGLVAVAALVIVIQLGEDIRRVFTGTHDTVATYMSGLGLADEGDGNLDDSGFNPYFEFFDEEAGDWLFGTPGADELDMNTGTYVGVMGYESNDNITGTEGGETVIPGPGDDTVYNRRGDDIYVYALGDGSDSINDDGGTDRLVFPDLDPDEVRFSTDRYGREFYFEVLTDESKTRIVSGFNARSWDIGYIESVEFADGTILDLGGSSSKAVNDMKSLGGVYMTEQNDTLEHIDGDGSYTVSGAHHGDDTLSFPYLEISELTLDMDDDGQSFRIETPGGDSIFFSWMLSGRSKFNHYLFAGTEYTPEDFIAEIHKDEQEAGGPVHMCDIDDLVVHSAATGASYAISRSDPHGNDTVNFIDFNWDEATYDVGSDGNTLLVTTPYGDDVYIDRYLYGSPPWIETLLFNGTQPAVADLIAKAHRDEQVSGDNVHMTGYDDTVMHSAATGASYTISRSNTGGTDTVNFEDFDVADASLDITSDGNTLSINTPYGDTVYLDRYLYGTSSPWIENVIFNGTAVSVSDLIAQAHEDELARGGTIHVTDRDDTITHISSLHGSYMVDNNRTGGIDTIIFSETNFADATFASINSGRNLEVTTAGGDTIIIDYGLYNRWLENIEFLDGVRTWDEVEARIAAGG